MLLKKPTFYLAVAGTVATIVMVAHLHGQSPIKPPPIDPSPKPYELSVAASGIIEALSENVAVGVPEAGSDHQGPCEGLGFRQGRPAAVHAG